MKSKLKLFLGQVIKFEEDFIWKKIKILEKEEINDKKGNRTRANGGKISNLYILK